MYRAAGRAEDAAALADELWDQHKLRYLDCAVSGGYVALIKPESNLRFCDVLAMTSSGTTSSPVVDPNNEDSARPMMLCCSLRRRG
jgi:hypothetical protein